MEVQLARELRAFHARDRYRQTQYAAAQQGRLSAGLPGVSMTPLSVLRRELRVLRARSRYERGHNDHLRRFYQLLADNVVGAAGIELRPQVLNGDGKPDVDANRTIAEAWAKWGRKGSAEISGRLSWVDCQRLTVQTAAMDGEWLHRWVRQPGASPYGFAIQPIDPELLDVTYQQDLGNGRAIRCGIELDEWDRAVAFHLIDQSRAQLLDSYLYHGRRYVRLTAGEVLHAYWQDQVGQIRGLPWASTSLLRLAMLEGFEDAAVVAARVGASKMGWLERTGGSGYTGEGTDAAGNTVMDAAPGTVEELPVGVTFKSWDPAYPTGEMGPFSKHVLRGISAGWSVPYASLTGDLEGVNYSSIRAGLLEARQFYRDLQAWVIEQLCRPVYEQWLDVQLLAGNLVPPDGRPLPAAKRDKYLAVTWQGPRWEWVDPLKEMQAMVLGIDKRLVSRTEAASQRGRVWAEVLQELAQEEQQAELAGVTLSAAGASGENVGARPPAGEQEDA